MRSPAFRFVLAFLAPTKSDEVSVISSRISSPASIKTIAVMTLVIEAIERLVLVFFS